MEPGARLSFAVNYDDPQAGVTRKYQLCYYTQDDTLEMHDIKNRRIFLKRCSYPQVAPSDLFLGATVSVHARRLKVVAYADDATQRIFQHKSATTITIVRPEGVERLGDVIRCANASGLRVTRINMLRLTGAESGHLQAIDPSAGNWGGHPIVAIELTGSGAHETWQNTAEAREIGGGVWVPEEVAVPQITEWFFEDPDRRDRSSATLQNCSLVVVKPHAVRAGHSGDIIKTLLEEGFEISALRLFHLSKADAEDFLEVYKGVVPEYTGLVEQMSSAPALVLEVRAEGAVQALRSVCGPHDPEIAKVLRPSSLRARFGETRVCNAVHCTDLPEDGTLECDFFFDMLKQ